MRKQSGQFGFTLVELMIVVTIVSILAGLASFSYGRITKRSRINEAVTTMAAIAGAQSMYYTTYYQYCSTASTPNSPSDADYDPSAASIRGQASGWDSPSPLWSQCMVMLPTSTHFQYVVAAGNSNTGCSNPPSVSSDSSGSKAIPACNSVDEGGDWWYVVARGDQDGDDNFSVFGTSSGMSDSHWSIEDIELE